jgi:heptosyltransferase-2
MGLRPDEPFVLINAGARPASAKGYPAELWGAIAAELSGRDGLAVVMVGGPGEEESVRAALAAAGEARALALLDPVCDLGELAALAAGASVVLTADTGARHVAAAVGAKIVCLVGPTDPRHSAAHLEFTTLLREPVPCGPCHRERCPLAGQEHHACMTSIAVSGVRDAALALLNG